MSYYLEKRSMKFTNDPVALERQRAQLVKSFGESSDQVAALDAHRQKLVDTARGTEEGFTKGFKDKKSVQKSLKGKKPSGKELAQYDPTKLTRMQNIKALGHEFKPGKNWRPDKVVKKGWRNLGEGGGGYAAGARYGQFMPMGGKAMTGMFALGDAKDAINRSDPTGEGRSKTERLGYGIGGALGGTAGALSAKTVGRMGMMGMPANILLSLGGMAAGYYAGGKLGKGIDAAASKARGVEAGDYTRTQKARIKKKLRSL